jgi:two-component system sensor histidine kinase ChvG
VIRRPSRIAVRLLLFNVLVVFLPIAGLFSLHSLELQLLDLQERAQVQQGRIAAAALASSGDGVVTAEAARRLVLSLGGKSEARIRILDRAGRVLADSASMPARATAVPARQYTSSELVSRRNVLYRFGVLLWQPVKALGELVRSGGESPSREAAPRTVVEKALAGRYGAMLRESPGARSLTLYSALPIANAGGPVTGAVVVSQSTARTLRALWRVRLDVFRVFVLSVIAAMVLSLLFATTIARPLIRLRDEADELLDPRGRLRRTFRGSRRRDEIGDLARALETLTARFERHLAFVESFSADVSHEFKNPLASIRSAAELLALTDDAAQKEQLSVTIDTEVARLNRLLNGVREVSRIDAALDTELTSRIDLRPLLRDLDPRATIVMPAEPVVVVASADRLRQAFGNVVDNALSFSPSRVTITLAASAAEAIVTVDDEGPGIPPEHLERIFDRFFSFRPDPSDARRTHDGLGLAIARAIIEGYGGRITASNREARGARITITLPIAKG